MSGRTPDIGDGFFPAIGDDFGDGLTEDLRARVKSELEPGERLLWAARSSPPPEPLSPGYFIAFLLGLLVLALGVGAVGHDVVNSQPHDIKGSMPLGMVFTLGGILVVICTFWARISAVFERGRQMKACYAVTDRRGISWIPETDGDAIRVRSIHRGEIFRVVRVERPDGSGSLEFTLRKNGGIYSSLDDRFMHIPEVRRVEQIVRNYLMTPEKTS